MTPVYPYAIGQTYYGNIVQTDGNMGLNSGFKPIVETVIEYKPASTPNENSTIEIITEMEVYPNPTSDYLQFLMKSNEFNHNIKGEIFDLAGTLIKSGIVSTNRSYKVDVSDYNEGLYFFKFSSGERSYSFKFIVIKDN
jgi:hypothetical protein